MDCRSNPSAETRLNLEKAKAAPHSRVGAVPDTKLRQLDQVSEMPKHVHSLWNSPAGFLVPRCRGSLLVTTTKWPVEFGSLSSPTGGEGWGEEAHSTRRRSPRSFLAGRGRKRFPVVVATCSRRRAGSRETHESKYSHHLPKTEEHAGPHSARLHAG